MSNIDEITLLPTLEMINCLVTNLLLLVVRMQQVYLIVQFWSLYLYTIEQG